MATLMDYQRAYFIDQLGLGSTSLSLNDLMYAFYSNPPSGGGISDTVFDAKGDLLAASAADTPARLPVGTNGTVLTANSAASTGLAWADHIVLTLTNAADVGLIVKGAAAQAANLQQWQNSAGTVLASIRNDGAFLTPTILPVSGANPYLATGVTWALTGQATTGSTLLSLRASTGQTANIQEWGTNAALGIFAITAAGLPKWALAGNEQTTVGAAGGGSALPATPTKYLKVVDSAGTTLVIPAYAAS